MNYRAPLGTYGSCSWGDMAEEGETELGGIVEGMNNVELIYAFPTPTALLETKPKGLVVQWDQEVPPGGLFAPLPSPHRIEYIERNLGMANVSLTNPHHGPDPDVPIAETIVPLNLEELLRGLGEPPEKNCGGVT